MAESAVNVNFPGPPVYEQRSTVTGPTTGTDTTTKPVTPREEAAQGELATRTTEEIAFTERKRAQDAKAAGVEQQNIELQQFAEQAQENLRNGPEAQAARKYVDWARQRTRDEEDRLSKMPAPALFADREGWGKVRLAVGLGFAGLGDGMINAAAIRVGHAPTNRNTVGSIIEMDLDRQRAAIEKQRDSVVQARTGLKDADEARRALLAEVELRGKHMFRQAELLTRSRLAALKLDQAAIDQTKEILDLKRAGAEKESAFASAHGTSVQNRFDYAKVTNETINRTPSATGGGGIEADKAGAQFALFKDHAEKVASVMPTLSPDEVKQLNRVMSSEAFLEGKGTVNSVIQGVLGVDAETGASLKVKSYLEDVRRGAAALGRMDSGAAIGTVENIRFIRAQMPNNSDDKAALEMRAGNIMGDVKIRGEFLAKPGKYAGSAAIAPTPAVEQKAPSEFTPERVANARAAQANPKVPRVERERLRKFVEAAAKAGVK